MATRTGKHASCIAHPKLYCGCKICETPQSTAHIEGLAKLAAFHSLIHTIQAQRAARPRLAGDGRIEGPNGERYTPTEVVTGYATEENVLRDKYGHEWVYHREGRYNLGAMITLNATSYAPASATPSRFAGRTT